MDEGVGRLREWDNSGLGLPSVPTTGHKLRTYDNRDPRLPLTLSGIIGTEVKHDLVIPGP